MGSQENSTAGNIHAVHDERSETFEKSRNFEDAIIFVNRSTMYLGRTNVGIMVQSATNQASNISYSLIAKNQKREFKKSRSFAYNLLLNDIGKR